MFWKSLKKSIGIPLTFSLFINIIINILKYSLDSHASKENATGILAIIRRVYVNQSSEWRCENWG